MLILLMYSKHLHTTWHIWFSWLVEFIENTIHSSDHVFLPPFLYLSFDEWQLRGPSNGKTKSCLPYDKNDSIPFSQLWLFSKIRLQSSSIRQQTEAINVYRKLTSLLKANTYQNLVWWHFIKVSTFIPNKHTF